MRGSHGQFSPELKGSHAFTLLSIKILKMNPYKFNEPICVAFSGGRSSGFMLKNIIDAGIPEGSVVIFCNTGKEEEATLEFVRDCGVNFGVDIIWLEYTSGEERFKVVDFNTASRNGEPFEELIIKKKYLPNPMARFCTIEMKIRITSKYCKSIGLDFSENDAIVGFRADEPRRIAKLADKSRAPMGRAGHTKQDVMKFWNSQSFDLNLPNINGVTKHGNCDLCFLKGAGQILSLISEKPERALWWARMEELVQKSGGVTTKAAETFRCDRPSYKAMLKYSKDQSDFFGHDDESISCFCGD